MKKNMINKGMALGIMMVLFVGASILLPTTKATTTDDLNKEPHFLGKNPDRDWTWIRVCTVDTLMRPVPYWPVAIKVYLDDRWYYTHTCADGWADISCDRSGRFEIFSPGAGVPDTYFVTDYLTGGPFCFKLVVKESSFHPTYTRAGLNDP